MLTKIRSITPLFALLCAVSALPAQSTKKIKWPRPVRRAGPPAPVVEPGLELNLQVKEHAIVDPQAIEQLKAHNEFLAANQAWEEEADKVLEELRKEEIGLYTGLGDHNMRRYPKKVRDRMPPRPEYVKPPTATPLKWSLTLKNISEKPIDINPHLYCDMASIKVTVSGPGAHHIKFGRRYTTMEIRSGSRKTLQPGESHTVNLRVLTSGARMMGGDWAITERGSYELTVTYSCASRFRGGRYTVTGTTPFEAKFAE